MSVQDLGASSQLSDGLLGGKVGGIIYKTDFTFLRLSLRQIILRALWSDQKRYTKC